MLRMKHKNSLNNNKSGKMWYKCKQQRNFTKNILNKGNKYLRELALLQHKRIYLTSFWYLNKE